MVHLVVPSEFSKSAGQCHTKRRLGGAPARPSYFWYDNNGDSKDPFLQHATLYDRRVHKVSCNCTYVDDSCHFQISLISKCHLNALSSIFGAVSSQPNFIVR